jgi:hypothetical protein
MSISRPLADPLGLFSQPQPAPKPPTTSSLSTIISIALLGLVVFLAYQRFAPDFFGDKEHQKDEQKDQKRDEKKDEKQDIAPKIEGKTLIFVHERDPQPIEHDLLLREIPGYTAQKSLQFRVLDDDMPEAQPLLAFAKLKGIDSPCVILTDRNDKPASVIPWPKDVFGLEALK